MEKLLIYDLETSGLDSKKHGILEISFEIIISGISKEKHTLKMNLYDDMLTDPGALNINRLFNYETFPNPSFVFLPFKETLEKYINKYESSDRFHLVGWNNLRFDDKFLRNWFDREKTNFNMFFYNDSIDVMSLAAHKLRNKRHRLPNFKLATVSNFMIGKVDLNQLHGAEYDLKLTKEIYYALQL